ncbi:glutathione S-transferase C-terminal domain-containing protein [Fusicatenibacter saccharivorans]|uniref:glutathione S-transferase C-terminal domain-containing protein n=1 Tax=Fusicatenibacter saccharivorans TaxID=1150298 RepID=UPI0006C43B8B|nr:Uncharacterised protein [Fusicatenibacter saccharivorans]
MANYDYEIVNGRKIRVRPKETVSEIDKNGYFRRQPNHFTTPFGDGENDLKAEGNKRYRLVWAKLCHWSNRAAIVRELEGLEDQISVNMVEHAPHEKNLGWEYVYNENNIDPVLGDQFLSEAYYRADDDYQGRTTVPALIDTTTGKVVNNAVYRSSFSRSNEGHFDGVNTFYAAMDRLEKRLETNRFLFGDYVTDSDIRLYVTLARLDIRYTAQLGETKHPLYTYKNLWGYAKELWEIPAFKNNTFFADFAVPPADAKGSVERSFNVRFLKQLDFAQFWGNVDDRSALSSDPEHKLKAETDAGTARSDADVETEKNREDAAIYAKIHAIPSTEFAKYTEEELTTKKDPASLPPLADTREEDYQTILAEIRELPDGPELSPTANAKSSTAAAEEVKKKIAEPLDTMLNAVELAQYVKSAKQFYGALKELETALGATRFLAGDFVTEADAALYVTLVRFDLLYSRYLGPVKYRVQDLKNVSDYLKDLYQIPAFAHHTDFAAIIRQGRIEGEEDGFRASTHYDLALPKIDWDAQWKVSTERAYLSSDPTHPIYLGNNRRFDIDPTWYDLGAESPKKEEKETPPSCGCCCG